MALRTDITVTLPWPSSKLSPNARVHWRPKADVTKSHRYAANVLTLEALGRATVTTDTVPMAVTFCPPNARRRDLLNCIGSFKAYEDGLSDAIGIDDSKFIADFRMGDVVKGGCVVVTFKAGAA